MWILPVSSWAWKASVRFLFGFSPCFVDPEPETARFRLTWSRVGCILMHLPAEEVQQDAPYAVILDILVFLRAFLAAAEPRWGTRFSRFRTNPSTSCWATVKHSYRACSARCGKKDARRFCHGLFQNEQRGGTRRSRPPPNTFILHSAFCICFPMDWARSPARSASVR